MMSILEPTWGFRIRGTFVGIRVFKGYIGLPKIRGTSLGDPLTRNIVFWGSC